MSSITTNNYVHLRMFNDGLQIDVCIEISNSFGLLFPSKPQGRLVKMGSLRDLKAKGLIDAEIILSHGLEYKRYSISELGKKRFKEYVNDCSKK